MGLGGGGGALDALLVRGVVTFGAFVGVGELPPPHIVARLPGPVEALGVAALGGVDIPLAMLLE